MLSKHDHESVDEAEVDVAPRRQVAWLIQVVCTMVVVVAVGVATVSINRTIRNEAAQIVSTIRAGQSPPPSPWKGQMVDTQIIPTKIEISGPIPEGRKRRDDE